jgi:hypothetical protein
MTNTAKVVDALTWKLLHGMKWNCMTRNRFGSALTKKPLLGDTTDTRTGHDVPSDISS